MKCHHRWSATVAITLATLPSVTLGAAAQIAVSANDTKAA